VPAAQRHAIRALAAYCRELEAIGDGNVHPDAARAKLGWWRREIAAVYRGVPQHPVGMALRPVVTAFGLREAHFQRVIDGITMDVERTRYVDFAALEGYCHRVGGMPGIMSAEVFGARGDAARGYGRDLGIALRLTRVVRNLGADARRGRIYVPQDDLARYRVPASALLRCDSGGGFRALIAEQAARARDWYRRALAQLPESDRAAQRAGLIMAAIYRALLDEIEASGFPVLDERVSLTPLRKFWIAWSTARTVS
jgi:phytoene synthase